MKLNHTKVLTRALQIYRQKKYAKGATSEEIEEIKRLPSDQVESLAQAIVEEINKNDHQAR